MLLGAGGAVFASTPLSRPRCPRASELWITVVSSASCVPADRARLARAGGDAVQTSNRMTIDLEVGVLDPSAVESSGISELASGK